MENAEAIRFLLDTWFQRIYFGIPRRGRRGDERVCRVLIYGFYPVTPGLPVYTIEVPCSVKYLSISTMENNLRLLAHSCSVVK